MSLGWPQAARYGKMTIKPRVSAAVNVFYGCLEMDEQSGIGAGDRIKAKLQAAFAPDSIEVIDESPKHASHAHAMKPGAAASAGGTHFHIKVVSEAFKGKSLVERHRSINHLLRAEFDAGVHALAIEAKAPGE
jgi:BolA family transcriptional regulator, general stress-responsive regulator